MTLITIDKAKCKKDGLCVQECPAAIIKQADGESVPLISPQDEQMCLLCGHCVAICPHDALTHEKVPMEASPQILKELAINKEQAVQFLRTRRSVRRFKNKAVDKETIQFLIDTARYAPTGGNTQQVTWTVHTDESQIKKIADLTIDWLKAALASDAGKEMPSYIPVFVAAYESGINTITYNAPCLVFASTTGEYENGMIDLSIAFSYLELLAASCGLGTCWLGLITRALKNSEPLMEAVGLPEGHSNFYAMILGHPQFRFRRLPERKPAKIFWK